MPYFHERSLEENLYIFLQEPAAIHLREDSQDAWAFFPKINLLLCFLVSRVKENGEPD
ncbi:hypothetical protein ACN9TI_14410 [Lactococcus lactis]